MSSIGMTFWRNLRYAVRNLRNRPALTIAAIASLAIGIGANTALFSVLNAALFRPLGIRDPAPVFSVAQRAFLAPNGRLTFFESPVFQAMREQAAPLLDLAAYDNEGVDLTTESGVHSALGALVTANYFKLLGVSPILGRDFTPDEDRVDGASPVTVISERLWRSQFHSDATAPGRTLRINGHLFTVIGVMPGSFTGTVVGSAPEVWVPSVMLYSIDQLGARIRRQGGDPLHDRSMAWLNPLARLAPGVSPEAARARLNAIFQPFAPTGVPAVASPIELSAIETSRLPLQYSNSAPLMMRVLFAVVGVLLLIACANTASLLMGRAFARRKEIAIRFALGARRGQVVSGLLMESAVLAIAGGALGILLAMWIAAAIESWHPVTSLPIPANIAIDGRVLAFTALISILSGLALGLGTGLHATRGNVPAGLNEIPASPARRGRWLSARDWLVAGQVALSLCLLVAAGLLARTLVNLESIDIGFDPRNLIVVDARLTQHGFSDAAAMREYPQLLERARTLPGVDTATLAQYVPLASAGSAWTYGEGPQKVTYLTSNAVSREYFHTLGIQLISGRNFTDSDREGAQPVAIVNETMARVIMKTADPLGKIADIGRTKAVVVGMVRDNKTESLRQHREPWWYVPYGQDPQSQMSLLIKTRGDARSLIRSVRQAVRQIDSSLPDSSVALMTDNLQGLLWQPRSTTLLVGAFAGLAALLAMVGLYGAVSFYVSQKLRDVGIRMTLGAGRSDVLRLVVGRGTAVALIGVLLGEIAAIELSRLLTVLLYGVRPTDPLVLTAAPMFLIAVAALSSFLPARRALRSDPITVLRYQ